MSLNFKNVSVLVAEDNSALSSILKNVLQEFGFGSITMTTDGTRAFQAFCEGKHDIIISDWEMEPVSGIEFLKKVRFSPASPDPTVPFIFVSGYAAPKRVLEARDGGMTTFIVKPFTIEELAKRITYIINKPRPFIDSKTFKGPDRRRSVMTNYQGKERRRRQSS